MINPKYDPNNYTKHSPIIIIADYQLIDKLFRSYLLLIKWKTHGTSKALDSASNVGIIRQLVETPLGKEVPKDFQLQVSKVNEVYTQFLTISSDWEYQLSILNPIGIAKTSIEIWEYHQPQTYLGAINPQSNLNSPSSQSIISDDDEMTTVNVNNNFYLKDMGVSFNPSQVPAEASVGSNVTSKAASPTSIELIAAAATPAARTGGVNVDNKSNKNMYVKFGIGAATVASKLLPPGANIDSAPNYDGPVQAIWDAGAVGNAEITEWI